MPDSPAMTVYLPEERTQQSTVRGGQSEQQRTGVDQTTTQHREDSTVSDSRRCEQPQNVITALADSQSRAILAAVANSAKIVPDIVSECQIATATAYRKVERLTKAGLLTEQIRIRRNDPNIMEYQLAIDQIRVTLESSGEPAVELVGKAEKTPTMDETESISSERSIEEPETPDMPNHSITELFTKLTGETVFIEPQESSSRRYLSDDHSPTATELNPSDGLAEAYPEMDPELFE